MSNNSNDTDNSINAPPETVFSTIVTAISGARQTANQEFNRFWDKLTHNTTSTGFTRTQSMNNVYQKPHSQIFKTTSFGNEGDLARIEAGKTIYGRLLPDNHRRAGHIKNAEIQTDKFIDNSSFSIKRKSSLIKEDMDETLTRPTKISRNDYRSSVANTPISVKESNQRYIPQLTQQSLFAESLSPVQSTSIPTQQTSTREPFFNNISNDRSTSSTISPVRTSSPRASPIRASPIRATSPVRSSLFKSSPVHSSPVKSSPFKTSPFRSSPVRASPDNHIKTGSAKSVKRLTFELEEAFSPRFPLPVGQPRKQNTTYDNIDPFHSTPLIKKNANDDASIIKTDSTPIRESDSGNIVETVLSVDQSSSDNASEENNSNTPKAISFNDEHVVSQRTESNTSQVTSPLRKSPSKRFDQEEEDRRIEELERNVNSIKSQMHNYVTYPSMRSPKPSHTITADTTNNTTISYKHNYPISHNEQKILSPIRTSNTFESSSSKFTSSLSPQTTTTIRASSTPNRLAGSSALRESISTGSSTTINSSAPIKTSTVSQPSSPYKFSSKSSNSNYSTPPPAPPAPPPVKIAETSKIFSPVRDIPNALLSKRLHSSTNYSPPKSIKESQLAPFLGPNIAINEKTRLKPSDEHKSTMRELIQLIPGVKLRKTDKLIGPDGKERPNPFWNEIYNRNGRKLY